LSEHIAQGNPAADSALDLAARLGLNHQQALGLIDRLVQQQSYTIAVDEMFRLSAWLFLALIVLVWLVKPTHNGAKVDASAAH